MKTVFMGTPDFAAVILDALAGSRHDVAYAVTQPDKAKNRGKKVQYTPVKELALAKGIEVLQPEKRPFLAMLFRQRKAHLHNYF